VNADAQAELLAPVPYALVAGRPVVELPRDLYIPPDALEVFLDSFEGPLDLLLWLIRRQNLDVLDIPIAAVAAQYMGYVELMEGLRLELAAEYLLMAAMLAEIKSRMLLPRPAPTGDEEGDPRAELVRRLQEYERYRDAARDLDARPRLGRDVLPVQVALPELAPAREPPRVELGEILTAFAQVLARAELRTHHRVGHEPLSVREKMAALLEALAGRGYVAFSALLRPAEGRAGLVAGFIALLELLRERLIEARQDAPYGPIYLRAVGG
jgi:segregation and condensation protein A